MKATEKRRLYFAAPLFSAGERAFNEQLAKRLSHVVEVFLPQEQGSLFVDLVARGSGIRDASKKIFSCDIKAIQQCDLLLIVLDGRSVDEGAAFELGYGFALGKICIGLQTDMRRLLPIGNNPMIDSPLEYVAEDCGALIDWVKHWLSTHEMSLPFASDL